MAAAVAMITVLRSNLSPINSPMIGPTGAEMAMMDEYSRAVRDGDSLLDEECRHPVGETVEADCLEDVKDAHHDGALAVGATHRSRRLRFVVTGSGAAGAGSG